MTWRVHAGNGLRERRGAHDENQTSCIGPKWLVVPLLLALCSAANALAQEGANEATPARSVWDGVYTTGQASRGAAIYRRDCGNCHGANLRGGEIAPALAGIPFQLRWRGKTVGAYYELTVNTMPQDNPASLDPQTYADLVAYILQANRFPAGEQELAAGENLDHILIEKRPSPRDP
jgi:mono/diheme cytochrome c family protein